jgi:twitching motility protein PilT
MSMSLANLLLETRDAGASDLHLTVGSPPAQRLHGALRPLPLPPLSRDDLRCMLREILTDEQSQRLERDLEADFALELGDSARFRANVYTSRLGEGAVFRVIPTRVKTLDELGMPPVLKDLARKPRGLVLVTGPTGCGKSTTLAAMIDFINSTEEGHILTIEDPIEFVHPHKKCLVNQREVGSHTRTFASALRSALREDPDVILVGEMRDLETISLAIAAAETGHLVFGTLHTSSAPKTVDRLIDVFPPEQQEQIRVMLSESIQAVVCQTLVPKRTGDGRVCALEVMVATTAVRSLIREGKTFQLNSIIQVGAKYGMQSMDQQLKELSLRGLITREAAMDRANSKFLFEEGGGSESAGAGAGADTAFGPAGARAPTQIPRQTQDPTAPAPKASASPSDADSWMQVYGKKK